MGIASGLLIFAMVNTYTELGITLKEPIENIQEQTNKLIIIPSGTPNYNQGIKPIEDYLPSLESTSIQESQYDTWIPFEDQEESKESQLEALGSFRFKLSEEQINELDCWNKPKGYEIVLTIERDMYFFRCP